jgi:hypothetical protein
VTGSTFSGNDASFGGGIYNQGLGAVASTTVANSTLVANTASVTGSQIDTSETEPNASFMSVTNSTLVEGSVSTLELIAAHGAMTLANAVLAGDGLAVNCVGTITSDGYNLSSDSSCGLTGPGDHQNVNPQLGPLQDNGGPTQTIAPLPGSPAIDTGSNAICAAALVNNLDQRGFARPIDGGGSVAAICDRGAVEFGSAASVPMHVAAMTMYQATCNGQPRSCLQLGVRIASQGRDVVGAQVTVLITAPDGATQSLTATTGGLGNYARFTITPLSLGTYTASVTNVTAPALTYDPAENTITSVSVVVKSATRR